MSTTTTILLLAGLGVGGFLLFKSGALGGPSAPTSQQSGGGLGGALSSIAGDIFGSGDPLSNLFG